MSFASFSGGGSDGRSLRYSSMMYPTFPSVSSVPVETVDSVDNSGVSVTETPAETVDIFSFLLFTLLCGISDAIMGGFSGITPGFSEITPGFSELRQHRIKKAVEKIAKKW